MKKTYIQPTFEACNLPEESILAGSPDVSADPSQQSETMDAKDISLFSWDILTDGSEE